MNGPGARGAMEKLTGRVTRITLRQLRDGRLYYDTRIDFDAGQWARSVRLTGHLPELDDWREHLLAALDANGFDVLPDVPEPRWREKAKRAA